MKKQDKKIKKKKYEKPVLKVITIENLGIKDQYALMKEAGLGLDKSRTCGY